MKVCARLARAEAHWLAGHMDAARREAELAYGACQGGEAWEHGGGVAWLRRAGSAHPVRGAVAEPYRLEFAGDAEAAAAAWVRLGCPYEAALALAGATGEDNLRDALRMATSLGAKPLARIISQRLRRAEARLVPARRG